MLDSLVGLNKNALYLNIGGDEISAIFDDSQMDDDRVSAVQYIKFKLSDLQILAFGDEAIPVSIDVRHPNYLADHTLSHEQRSALFADLRESNADVLA